MAKLEIITYPDSLLRQTCKQVENIDDDILRIIQDMSETMYINRGIGLAAPQVGVLKNIIILDIGNGLISLLNPEITDSEGKAEMEEGCLCLPEITVEVERDEKIQVKGINRDGRLVTFDAEGLLARVFQHEIDHLHGTLIIDKLSKLKRDLAIKKLKKLKAKSEK